LGVYVRKRETTRVWVYVREERENACVGVYVRKRERTRVCVCM